MTETELLAVLDMSEEEQKQAIVNLLDEETMEWFVDYDMHLADLALRLRDEVCKKSCEIYYKALEAVYNHRIKDKQCCSFYAFQMYQIQPIDIIVAALMAKENK